MGHNKGDDQCQNAGRFHERLHDCDCVATESRHTEMAEQPWHARPCEEAIRALETDAGAGLSHADAAGRLAAHGPNELAAAKSRSFLALIAHQFRSLIVGLLALAAGVAFIVGDHIEAIAILVVILLNALIGFFTEWKAATALDSLRKQAVSIARVRREGTQLEIPAADLVTGDIVLLAAGDRVPADARLLDHATLQVDEAALTGESVPVLKSTDPIPDPDAPIGDRLSMVYLGTAITDGRGTAVVTATGPATEMGRIGTLIDDVADKATPLEGKLAQLSRALLVIVLGVCAVIVATGWLRGIALLNMVEIGISLAIAAIPEGLVAVTTMTLAVGMQRMARMGALVRRLPAVESLGSTTVICSDKTGTLTRNEMTVRTIALGDRRVDVDGSGYDTSRIDALEPSSDAHLDLALRIGALCNDAALNHSDEGVTVLGDPTEGALLVVADKAGLDRERLAQDYPRIAEVPFTSESKRMVTVHRTPEGTTVAYVKGAPDALIAASSAVQDGDQTIAMTDEGRTRAAAANHDLASSALRVLALAYRPLPETYTDDDLARDLTLVGFVGMLDPLREEARETIATCRTAGIRTVMITGDQETTAAEIGRQLGLDTDAHGHRLRTVHGRELHDLDDAGWRDAVADAAVFARVSPEHKLRIVEALQRGGHIVAMTGDGVNDAPALRQADIGIAMGIRGTEVAKESSAMVITDDNFSTIVTAVEQGRIIVNNILRFIHFLFSCNLAEVLTVFVAIMIGWPLPLGVLQILWLNLVTDIFPAMALALEPSAPDVMTRPPRDPSAPLMTRRFGWLIVWQGALLATCTLAAFRVGMTWYGTEGEGLRHAVTIAFMALALGQVAHAFNARSQTRSALTHRVFTNGWLWWATALCVLLQLAAVYVPWLQRVLGTTPLGAADWSVIVLAAVAPVGVVEVVKLIARYRGRSR
jgi:Ca2+-transporting ATPase